MTRKEILEILNNKIKIREEYNPRKDICDHWIEGIDHAADAILALQIEVPDDKDIDNAALDYVDEVDNPFARKIQRKAYADGAKDMRDNNIFIRPTEE
jgi:hypothetical protein